MKASLGRVIVVKGAVSSNGAEVHPAIINRVWSDKDPDDAVVLVNVTIFPDCGAPVSMGSVRLFNTPEKAEAQLALQGYSMAVGYWPERV